MDFNKRSTVFITCAPGLSPWLERELRELDFSIESVLDTGVQVSASLAECMYLNLTLRSAFSINFELSDFKCESPDQLYENLMHIPFEDIIITSGYFSITTLVDNPTIDNTMFAALKAKDAIVDRMREKTGTRPDAGNQRNKLVFYLYWRGSEAKFYINTSGNKLSDRGYRRMPYKAPLRENLAASLIMATGYAGDRPLVCPMCGSGTLAIEAALIGLGRAPGLLRQNFSFMHIKDFPAEEWEEMRSQVRSERLKKLEAPIIATDIAPAAVDAARKNAMTAGVDTFIDFQVCDFAQTPVPEGDGIVILNPGYGERMGEVEELKKTYRQIGDFFKQQCSGYHAYIFTGNPDLAKCVGLRTSKRLIFFNGKIECRLLEYEMYRGSKNK